MLDIFSDQEFEFRLDRLLSTEDLAGVPGLREVEAFLEGKECIANITVESEVSARSEALYGIVQRLRERGYQLHSVSQRQQSLENVFLHLTASAK